jgi:hypothetical protein
MGKTGSFIVGAVVAAFLTAIYLEISTGKTP